MYYDHCNNPPSNGSPTGKAYKNLEGIIKYETAVNDRWPQLRGQGTGLPDLPFLLKPTQMKEGEQRCQDMKECGLIPAEVIYMRIEVIFSHPSWLKMHDKVIILGPILKYLLQGCFGLQERKKLFE